MLVLQPPLLMFASNPIAIWIATAAGDRKQLLRMQWVSDLRSLGGDTSSSLSVGFFSKRHNEISPFPSKMESEDIGAY